MAATGTAAAPVSPWQRLRVVLAPERRDLWIIVLYGIAVGLLSLAVPIATQALVNTAAWGAVLQPVAVLALMVLALLSLAGLLRVLQLLVAEYLQRRLFARMAIELGHRLPRTQVETYDRHRGTELVNRFLDVLVIQKNTALILLDGFALVLQTVVGMVLLGVYHPFLLGFDVVLLASMVFVVFVLGRGAVRTSVEESYRKYSVVAWLEELARTPTVFKSYRGTEHALQRADEAAGNYLTARADHFRILLRQIIGTLVVQALGSALLLGLGGWLVVQRQLSLGQLVAAELAIAPVLAGFAKFGKYFETTYDLLAAVDKVGRLFDLPLERGGGEAMPAGRPPAMKVRLRGVTFGYAGRPASLERLDLVLDPGSRTALLGPNGSGKSTVVDLLMGLRTPERGAVELDDVDLKDLSLEQARRHIGFVRGVELFDGTLLDNVRVGRRDIGIHEVREALHAVGLLDELAELPDGLSAELSGSQTPLSTGQCQRLMIARAIVGRPRLLVLDEALDSVDQDAVDQVLDALFSPDAPWTLLLTTHREALTRRCDRVMRIDRGRLEETAR